eukprot:IDg21471t1
MLVVRPTCFAYDIARFVAPLALPRLGAAAHRALTMRTIHFCAARRVRGVLELSVELRRMHSSRALATYLQRVSVGGHAPRSLQRLRRSHPLSAVEHVSEPLGAAVATAVHCGKVHSDALTRVAHDLLPPALRALGSSVDGESAHEPMVYCTLCDVLRLERAPLPVAAPVAVFYSLIAVEPVDFAAQLIRAVVRHRADANASVSSPSACAEDYENGSPQKLPDLTDACVRARERARLLNCVWRLPTTSSARSALTEPQPVPYMRFIYETGRFLTTSSSMLTSPHAEWKSLGA